MIPVAAGALASFEHLALALFHKERADAKLMAMTAYLDESGTHGRQSPTVIVGGFIADVAAWATYEHDLNRLLSDYGVAVFHAKKFRARAGDFKGWSRKKQGQFNVKFLKLIDEHLAHGFSAVLSSEEYDSAYKTGAPLRKIRQDTQYGLCFRVCLWAAARFMKENKEDWPLTVILESGHRNSGDAVRVFTEMQERLLPEYSNLLGAVAFESKKRCPPLAAADSFAYATFRLTTGGTKHPNPNVMLTGPADPPYIASRVPMTRIIITSDTLSELREDLLEQQAWRMAFGRRTPSDS